MSVDFSRPIFGFWYVKRKIGEGTYGAVYEMERTEENPFTHEKKILKAALKVISIPTKDNEMGTLRNNGMDDQSIAEYYRSCAGKMYQEIEVMSQLKGTSHIVSYENHQMLPHEDDPGWDILIQMELLIPMMDYAQYNPLSVEEIVKLGIDMCKALEICEQAKIIHRDIKPENIFLTQNGDFKLGDFGIAKTASQSVYGTVAGTYGYMAPEIFLNKPYGHTVDIYSVGLVLYKFLNRGRGMFMPQPTRQIAYGDSEKALECRMRNDPVPAPMDGDPALNSIVMKACSFYPEQRFTTARQMREALEAWNQGNRQVIPSPPPIPQELHGERSQNAAALEGVDIAMIVFCGCSIFFILLCLLFPEWMNIF